MFAGLIARADGPMTDQMRQALDERHRLIEQRASAVLDTALTDKQPWTRKLGPTPDEEKAARRWRSSARVVAAYRDRYQITDTSPLGPPAQNDAQKVDRARAETALRRCALTA